MSFSKATVDFGDYALDVTTKISDSVFCCILMHSLGLKVLSESLHSVEKYEVKVFDALDQSLAVSSEVK